MSKGLVFGVLLATTCLPALADPEGGTGTRIPDFSGGWARVERLVETYDRIPGNNGPGPMLVDPKHPHVDGAGPAWWVPALDNPILRPETLSKLRTIAEAEIQGIPHLKDESMCQPTGVPMLLNLRGAAMEILQTPDQVIMLNSRDQQVRFIYLNVPHSKTPAPGNAWHGESVGHYEGGDTLVVDTIGQNDKTQIDRFGTSHSDKMHVVERYRISPDRKTMEVQFTVTDPVAFTTAWSGRARFAAQEPSWEEEVCAENNRFVGKVTANGKVYTNEAPTPSAEKPEF
jgi:hypothetical protein